MRLDRAGNLAPVRPRTAGVALIEALVAMTVMAFGLLAVAGIQTTLRQNADVSKQRAEAVRIAQMEIETWRGYATMAGPPGSVAYDNLVSATSATVVTGSNVQFMMTRSVTPSTAPVAKVLTVDVAWTDRNNSPQSVRLTTAVAGVTPELSGTVVVSAYGSPTAYANGKHWAIPTPAISFVEKPGLSFLQPQAGNPVVWQFNNITGVITLCSLNTGSTALTYFTDLGTCAGEARMLSGYVRFSTNTTQPTVNDALVPTSAAFAIQVKVIQSFPSGSPGVNCFASAIVAEPKIYNYFCAVPVSLASNPPLVWSGLALVFGSPLLTDSPTETSADKRRVCRYTRYQDDRTVGTALNQMTNEEHPLNYDRVKGPLGNQNFLIIRAGNGTDAYSCPGTSTPSPSNTWRHPLS